MASIDESYTLLEEDKTQLQALAKESIQFSLNHGFRRMPLDIDRYTAALQQPRASFVTLLIHEALRGCMGTLEAQQALAEDVAHNAHAAAFRDPRFPRLNDAEFKELTIHISVLNPAQRMSVQSEQDLLNQLRPHVDGLILEDKGHRATFLPSVWESLSDPAQFVHQLKLKAGLAENYWSDSLQVSRYTTDSF